MLKEDSKMMRIAEDFTKPEADEAQISAARLAMYRSLFKKAGVRHGVRAYPDRSIVRFILSTRGLSVSGSTIGIVFLENTAGAALVTNIDSVVQSARVDTQVYQHIVERWYLFYEFER